jgi:hypothetical protein
MDILYRLKRGGESEEGGRRGHGGGDGGCTRKRIEGRVTIATRLRIPLSADSLGSHLSFRVLRFVSLPRARARSFIFPSALSLPPPTPPLLSSPLHRQCATNSSALRRLASNPASELSGAVPRPLQGTLPPCTTLSCSRSFVPFVFTNKFYKATALLLSYSLFHFTSSFLAFTRVRSAGHPSESRSRTRCACLRD